MNKDIQLLTALPALMTEIKALEERCAWQRDRLTSLTQHLSFTGGGGGHNPSGLDRAYALISELETEEEEKLIAYYRLFKEADAIIYGIKDLAMRAFVRSYYAEGKAKKEIMASLKLSEWDFRNARDMIEKAESMDELNQKTELKK